MGSRINVISQKATVIDEDHFRPYWIFLTYRHVFCAESEEEALKFLKTRKATHLLFCPQDLATFEGFGYVGSNQYFDRTSDTIFYKNYQKEIKNPNNPYFEIALQFPRNIIKLKGIYENTRIALKNVSFSVFDSSSQKYINKRFNKIYIDSKEVSLHNLVQERLEKTPYNLIIFSEKISTTNIMIHLFLVHKKAYNQLFVKLYVLNERQKHFTKIYEKQILEGYKNTAFQVWRIDYPEDKSISETLEKEYTSHDFPDEVLYKSWYFK